MSQFIVKVTTKTGSVGYFTGADFDTEKSKAKKFSGNRAGEMIVLKEVAAQFKNAGPGTRFSTVACTVTRPKKKRSATKKVAPRSETRAPTGAKRKKRAKRSSVSRVSAQKK